jgi:rubredoxin
MPKRPARRPPTQDAPLVQSWREATYAWPCPACPCQTNLRGLLRVQCSHCGHVHQPPEKESPHAD